MKSDRKLQTADDRLKSEILCRIPVFRPVAARLLRVLDDDHSVLEVADLLHSDPALSAEVLTAANSAVYSSRHQVNTLNKAIMMIGTERAKAVATRAALDAMHRAIGKHAVVERCWTHSRATAIIADWIAPFFQVHPDRAYTAGLMHDIGRLGLLALNADEYARLLEETSGTNRQLLETEEGHYRVDHCTAGLWLMNTWGLPAEFGNACAHHHVEGSLLQQGPFIELVRVACALADSLGYRAAPHVAIPQVEDLLAQLPNTILPAAYPLTALTTRLQAELGGLRMVPIPPPAPRGTGQTVIQ
jgi:HD-like signal output (HDOD) protein